MQVPTEFLSKIVDAISSIGEGYWFSGKEIEADDKIALEFIASDKPTITVTIEETEQ